MATMKDLKEGDWAWGYIINTNDRIRATFSNSNGLAPGYGYFYDPKSGKIITLYLEQSDIKQAISDRGTK